MLQFWKLVKVAAGGISRSGRVKIYSYIFVMFWKGIVDSSSEGSKLQLNWEVHDDVSLCALASEALAHRIMVYYVCTQAQAHKRKHRFLTSTVAWA